MKRISRYIIMTLMLGLLTESSLFARDLEVVTIGGRECYVYTVKKSESIYGVSQQLGISVGDITRYNPTAADGLRAGMKLYVPCAVVDNDKSAKQVSSMALSVPAATEERTIPAGAETYKVRRGESLYGVSRKFNISTEELIALNPSAEYGVKAGDILVVKANRGVSDKKDASQTTAYVSRSLDNDPDRYSLIPSEKRLTSDYVREDVPDYTQPQIDTDVVDTVNVAVMLPFMLHEVDPGKNAQLFLEFYKGLLLAADSLKYAGGYHVNIYAYDTAASSDTLSVIMSRPEMADMNLIIGPDSEAHMHQIAGSMMKQTRLYNAFNVKSALYATDSRVIQANIPHTPMLSKSVNAFMEMYPDHIPVFLSRIDGAADKDAFTSLLRQRLETDNREYQDITFRNLLSIKDLDILTTDTNYVFVPVSGSRAEFAKITESIKKFGNSRSGYSTRLFGYPDWIVFRGEYFSRLCDLEATIYTRFYADNKKAETEAIMSRFKAMYGNDMLDAAPVQGLLGFDTGMYLLSLLKEYGPDYADHLGSYSGLQSVMDFVGAPGEGQVNNALLIVTFTPDGSTIKTTLE